MIKEDGRYKALDRLKLITRKDEGRRGNKVQERSCKYELEVRRGYTNCQSRVLSRAAYTEKLAFRFVTLLSHISLSVALRSL